MPDNNPKVDLLAKTGWGASEPDQAAPDYTDLERGNIRQTGVALREGEIEALDAIGAELGGIARNALLRFAARRLIMDYRSGKLDLSYFVEEPPEPKKKLRMP